MAFQSQRVKTVKSGQATGTGLVVEKFSVVKSSQYVVAKTILPNLLTTRCGDCTNLSLDLFPVDSANNSLGRLQGGT